jgi:fibronectin-binding autotransporter adhesin
MVVDGNASFQDIVVSGGLLNATATATLTTHTLDIANGATLNVDNLLVGHDGQRTPATIAGRVTGAGRIDLGAGDDTLTVQDGADFSGLALPVDGGTGQQPARHRHRDERERSAASRTSNPCRRRTSAL